MDIFLPFLWVLGQVLQAIGFIIVVAFIFKVATMWSRGEDI